MKNKFIFSVLMLVFLAISCKTDDKNSGPEVNPDDAVAKVDTINPPAAEKKDTQRIWKVNIGLLPDIQFKGSGVKAKQIKPGKAAKKAGMQAGDIVIELDGLPVKTLNEYTMYMAKFKKGDFVEMTIIRGKQTIKKKLTFD
jgi:S1-C subfamily serine protease